MKYARRIRPLILLVVMGISLLPALSGCHRDVAVKVSVPILLYHDIAQKPYGDMIISESRFREHMKAIHEEGYHTISFNDLIAFEEQGTPLPERPVMITFDDGYMSNYEIAYPILKVYGFKATIFVIGACFEQGADRPGDLSYFGAAEANEMIASGLVAIQSHTYDMHSYDFDDYPDMIRSGVMQRDGESDADYRAAFVADYEKSRDLIEERTYQKNIVLAYPYGLANPMTEYSLKDMGVKVTLTTDEFTNIVKNGKPGSLRMMGRYTIGEGYSVEDLLNVLC